MLNKERFSKFVFIIKGIIEICISFVEFVFKLFMTGYICFFAIKGMYSIPIIDSEILNFLKNFVFLSLFVYALIEGLKCFIHGRGVYFPCCKTYEMKPKFKTEETKHE